MKQKKRTAGNAKPPVKSVSLRPMEIYIRSDGQIIISPALNNNSRLLRDICGDLPDGFDFTYCG